MSVCLSFSLSVVSTVLSLYLSAGSRTSTCSHAHPPVGAPDLSPKLNTPHPIPPPSTPDPYSTILSEPSTDAPLWCRSGRMGAWTT
eukprot:3931570-Rhodomonas_salina.1